MESGSLMSTNFETETFALSENAEEKRKTNAGQQTTNWGIRGFFWIFAALLVVLLSSPLWYRIAFGIILACIPVVVIALAQLSNPELNDPQPVALELSISGANVGVRFEDGRRVSYCWDDPSFRAVFLLVKYQDPERHRHPVVYFNNDSIYRGILLGPAAYDSLSRAFVGS